MNSQYKIIFSGPVGAGKTTAITSISDIAIVKTEEIASDESKSIKENTTVALDYGVITLEDKTKIHLYGTPGQKRFDFMWELLTQGGIGLLLLIDGSDTNALDNLKFFLNSFDSYIRKTCVVIGITKHDQKKMYSLNEYQQITNTFHPIIPIYEIDARNKEDISLILKILLNSHLHPKQLL